MLGVDVSKATLAVTLVDPVTRSVQWEQEFPNTVAGIGRLLKRTPTSVPLVLEPTGRYGLALVRQARSEERTVLLAQPRLANKFLVAVSPRAKTDRLDSRGLAVYGCCIPLPPYPLKSEAVEQLDQLLSARHLLSSSLVRLRQQQEELTFVADTLAPAIAALEQQIKVVDRQIAQRTRQQEGGLPQARALLAVDGIGPVTAAALASTLTSRQFPSSDAFVAYVGLDVRVRDSGKRRGQRAVTKQGHAELRRLLYLCAQANVKSKDSPFKEQYARELEKGLSSTAALVAVARKLARLAWSMVTNGTAYDRKRVYTRPPRKQQEPEIESATPLR